jgi:hypothetical protein
MDKGHKHPNSANFPAPTEPNRNRGVGRTSPPGPSPISERGSRRRRGEPGPCSFDGTPALTLALSLRERGPEEREQEGLLLALFEVVEVEGLDEVFEGGHFLELFRLDGGATASEAGGGCNDVFVLAVEEDAGAVED